MDHMCMSTYRMLMPRMLNCPDWNPPNATRFEMLSGPVNLINRAHFFPNPKNFFIFASRSPPPLPFPLLSFLTPSGFCADELPSA